MCLPINEPIDTTVPKTMHFNSGMRFHGAAFDNLSSYDHDWGYDHPGYYNEIGYHPLNSDWEKITVVNENDFKKAELHFARASYWIQNNINDWENTTAWVMIMDCSYFCFKHPRDAVRFKLLWK